MPIKGPPGFGGIEREIAARELFEFLNYPSEAKGRVSAKDLACCCLTILPQSIGNIPNLIDAPAKFVFVAKRSPESRGRLYESGDTTAPNCSHAANVNMNEDRCANDVAELYHGPIDDVLCDQTGR